MTIPPQRSAPVSARAGQHRYHLDLLLFGLFCLVLSAVFIGLHLTTPSDSARLSRGPQIFTNQGVFVSPYKSGEGPLREGDQVTAVDGISIETWSRGLNLLDPDRPRWRVDQFVTYTVLRDGKLLELPIPLQPLPLGAILRDHWSVILFFLASQVLAGFVYLQRHDDPAARALFIWAFSGSHTYTWAFFLQVSDLLEPAGFWLFHLGASGLWLVFWAACVHMTLVFPKQLLQLTRSWIVLLYLSSFILFGLYLAWQWRTAPGLLDWLDRWGTGHTLIAAVYSLPALILIVFQYLTSRSEVERIKTRWVIFGTLGSLSLGITLYFIPSLLGQPTISANILGLTMFPFIITMAIAIGRYRLFDIDLIIRRTLVYSLLTGLLSLLYFSGVALLQSLLTTDRGPQTATSPADSGQPSAVVIVLTTLAIAALFNPLRRRLQDFIDRRFYRQKYDAEKALAEFAAAASRETDLEQLSAHLTHTVQKTLQPARLNLWLIKLHSKGKQVEE
jgi:hypothetical protein